MLRFIWTISVFGGVPGHGAGMLFFELIEILRRTVWAVFRIEWEVIVKVCNGRFILSRARANQPYPMTLAETPIPQAPKSRLLVLTP